MDVDESLSLSDDLESLSDGDIACPHQLVLQVGDRIAQEHSTGGSGINRMCAPQIPTDSGSASIEITSLSDSGDDGKPLPLETGDLEMDYRPSDPPAYHSLMSNTAQTTSNTPAANRLSQELHGPSALSPADSSRQAQANSASAAVSTRSKQQRTLTASDSVRTQPGREVKQVRVSRALESCPPAVDFTKSSDITVNLDTSRSSRSKSSRTPNGSSSIGKSSSSRSEKTSSRKSSGTVSSRNVVKRADGTYVTSNGPGTVSFTVAGNVTINNHIDLRTEMPQTRVSAKPTKPKAKKRPVPAQGSKRRIQPTDIEILAGQLGDQWFRIGLSIGVDKGVLENIRVKYNADQQEMTRQMLHKWTHKFGRKATINYVVDALTDPKFALYDVAEKLPAD